MSTERRTASGFLSQGARAGAKISEFLVDFVLPPVCPVCHARVDQSHSLCGDCFRKLPLISNPIDPVTGRPLPFEVDDDLQHHMHALSPPIYRRARAATVFDDTARDLVHLLKYRDRADCAPIMSRLMAHSGRAILEVADIIIPVPLHRLRYIQRRYNQSMLLAKQVGEIADLPVMRTALLRKRATKPQVTLSGTERLANVQDAFSVPDKAISDLKGKTVVLLDDVLTTGATVNAATMALQRAGAYAVDILVFSVAMGDDNDHIDQR